MKKILALMICILVLGSCAQPKHITFQNGAEKTITPYGFLNEESTRNPDVLYKLSVEDIVLSVIFCETIIVPIIDLGYNLWEPVEAIEK